MTYIEAREILKDVRKAKNRARNLKARLNELQSDYAALQPLTASYGSGGGGKGQRQGSSVELAVERVMGQQQRFEEALLLAFELEDNLSVAIALLPEIEQDIIIGCYMDGKEHWKLANELGYEERTIRRKKNKAIHKIAELL